jgi:hypothetical protein
MTRRDCLATTTVNLFTSLVLLPVLQPNRALAACLPGDLSKECIGVYKVPIDDSILPYVGTPEALKRFAPDLNYVPPTARPTSVSQAMAWLSAQRLAATDIREVVAAGRLEEAGIKVLNLLPKVNTAGGFLVETLRRSAFSSSTTSAISQLRVQQVEDQYSLMIGLWGETDVMIGQGIRGDMGVSAVAQLNILKNIQEATIAMDDFLSTAQAAATAASVS